MQITVPDTHGVYLLRVDASRVTWVELSHDVTDDKLTLAQASERFLIPGLAQLRIRAAGAFTEKPA